MSGNIKYDKWINDDNTENYKCRAWVNFNGTGTVAIRASGGVSSITDTGTGQYIVNLTTAMADTNYSINLTAEFQAGTNSLPFIAANTGSSGSKTTSAFGMAVYQPAYSYYDVSAVYAAIFR